ncbi:MAG: hypothetical protein KJ956_13990 [Actinobacteria bacterium]|nr:hypothetical protein [Actinomycetota bacterium]
MRKKASQHRQKLVHFGERRQQLLQVLLGERGPLIRGTFGTRARKCGKPNCRCAQGVLHTSKYLSASQDGAVRQIHIPAADERKVGAGVKRYQAFQQTRKQLALVSKEELELLSQLEVELLEPYPPDNPLPAPKRRGRRSHGSDDSSA